MAGRVFSGIFVSLLLVGMLALAFSIQPAKAQPTTIIVPDDRPTIQEAINNANEGDTIFVKNGIYYENVVVNKTVTLVGESKETTIIDGNNSGSVVTVTASYAEVRGFTIQNSTRGYYHGSGIYVVGTNNTLAQNIILNDFYGISLSDNNTVSHNIICDNWGGVCLSHSNGNAVIGNTISGNYEGIISDNSNGNTFFYNTIDRSDDMGLALAYCCTNNTVFGNNASSNRWAGIIVSGGYGDNNTIYNNTASNNNCGIEVSGGNNCMISGNLLFSNVYGVFVDGDHDMVSHNNASNNWVGIYLAGSDSIASYNSAQGNDDAGIGVGGSHITVFGNNVTGNLNNGILIQASSSGSIVDENNVSENGLMGIWLTFSSGNTVSRNNVTANGAQGIYLHASSNNAIIGNNATANHSCGIILGYHSDSNTVSGNTAANSVNGIYQFDSCSNNTVSENKVTANSYGVWLFNSSWSDIIANDIENNNYGLQFLSASNNTIYHNNLIGNIAQAFTDSASLDNAWNDSYPSGGNYWSDYTGIDVKSGPNQDQPGSDSIGDTPYVIDQNNIDHYPLTNPWGAPASRSHILTVHGSSVNVQFTLDGVSYTTPWSGSYTEGSSVSLVMPETYIVSSAKYVWDRWSDGVVSRSRTVTMNTDISLTAKFTGPNYQLTITSSPIVGVPFTINALSKTTPYTEWLAQGSFTIEMPQTYDGYNWSKWFEDGDTNRTKTIYLHGTTWTGVYVSAGPPTPPVGGEWTPIDIVQLLTPWIAVAFLALASAVAASHRVLKKRR